MNEVLPSHCSSKTVPMLKRKPLPSSTAIFIYIKKQILKPVPEQDMIEALLCTLPSCPTPREKNGEHPFSSTTIFTTLGKHIKPSLEQAMTGKLVYLLKELKK